MVGYITLEFDDCYKTTLENVIPVLERFNFKATFGAIAGLAGEKLGGYDLADWETLREIARIGHEIASHSMSHVLLLSRAELLCKRLKSFLKGGDRKLFNKSYEEQYSKATSIPYEYYEVIGSKLLIDKKIPYQRVASFIYPYRRGSSRLNKLLKYAGYTSASYGVGINKLGRKDFFALKAVGYEHFGKVNIANNIAYKVAKNNYYMIEVFHIVDKNFREYPYFCHISDFEEHIKFLHDLYRKGHIVIDSQRNIVERLSAQPELR